MVTMTRRTLKTYFILDRGKDLVKIGKTHDIGQQPRWRLDSTSQDYWNGFRIKDEV